MKMKFGLLTILLVLTLSAAGCGIGNESSAAENNSNTADTEVATDSNENNNEEQSDNKIIATTVALVEIMDQLEIDLVGVPTTYKDLPERYAGLPEVGMAMEPDMEIIRSLQPTDVLTATTLTSYVEETFNQTNTPATYLDLESVTSMYEGIEYLGEKYDRVEQAKEIVHHFEEKLSEIESEIAGQESPKVLILLGIPGSYLVATEDSYVGDLVKRAGGTNAVPDKGVEFISANTETLQQTNADIILRMAHGMPDEVVEMFDQEFAENDIWQHFKAVQDNRVYDLEETLFGTTANLAAPEAMEELVGMLYPELAE